MDKNELGEHLIMNFGQFLLNCNPFWWSGNFLDSIGQSRSLCCVYKLGVGGLNKILGSWLRQIFYSFTFLPHLVNNIKVRYSEKATKFLKRISQFVLRNILSNAGLKFGWFFQLTFLSNLWLGRWGKCISELRSDSQKLEWFSSDLTGSFQDL